MAGANNKALAKAGMTKGQVTAYRAEPMSSARMRRTAHATAMTHSPEKQADVRAFQAKAAERFKAVAAAKASKGAKARAPARSSLLRLPLAKSTGLDVRTTRNVMADYVSPNVYARETRRQRMNNMMGALGAAVAKAPPGTTTVRFSVGARGEGGMRGAGEHRDFQFKARLLPGKGKGGQDLVAVNLVRGAGGALASRAARRQEDVAEARARGAGVKRTDAGALRIESRGGVVPFRHRGREMFAQIDNGRAARVVDAKGGTVRDPGAVRRGARVANAAMARSKAPKQAPALARQKAGADARAAVAAQVSARSALLAKRNRVAPTVARGSGGRVTSIDGSFSYRGKSYKAVKRVSADRSRLETFIESGGGLASKPSKGLRSRATRVIQAIEKRHAAGGKGVRYLG